MTAADLLALEIAPFEQSYSARDRAFYALALGLGHQSADPWALAYARQESAKTLPTFATTLGRPASWMKWPGFEQLAGRALHGEQRLTGGAPLPPEGRVRVDHRIVQVADKGPGRGAVVVIERRLSDPETRALYAAMRWVVFCRDAGGIGDAGAPLEDIPAPPAFGPEREAIISISPDAALLYSLTGDLNPIHADPAAARAAGFENPLMHGLWTYGKVAVEAMRLYGFEHVAAHDVRFSAPAFPGDRLAIDFWSVGDAIAFRCRAPDRQTEVIDRGFIRPA